MRPVAHASALDKPLLVSVLSSVVGVLIITSAASAVTVSHTIEGVLVLESGPDDPQLHGTSFKWTMLFGTTNPPADANDFPQFDVTEHHAISSTLTLTGGPQAGVYTDDEPGIAIIRDWPTPSASHDNVEYGSSFLIDNEPLDFLILFDLGSDAVVSPLPSSLPALFRPVGPDDNYTIEWSEDNDLSTYILQRGSIAAVPESLGATMVLMLPFLGLLRQRRESH